jgi:hypothetical protein
MMHIETNALGKSLLCNKEAGDDRADWYEAHMGDISFF